jgi:hypothetical protein
MKRASLFSLVQNLFSRGHSDDQARCLRCAFGCFSQDELESALGAIGGRAHLWISQHLRRLLLAFAFEQWRCRQPKKPEPG